MPVNRLHPLRTQSLTNKVVIIRVICGSIRFCPRKHHVLYSRYSRSLCYNQPIFRPSERKKRAPKAQIAKKTPFAGFFSKKLLSACLDVRHYRKSSSAHDLIRKTPDEKQFQIALCKTPCSINTTLYRRAKFFCYAPPVCQGGANRPRSQVLWGWPVRP